MMRLPSGEGKIAIVGSAPSSIQLAPYDDMSWAIWCCSPGAYGVAKRSDVWVELHRWHPAEPGRNQAPGTRPWFSSEFHFFLKTHPLVLMTQVEPSIPNSHAFPFDPLIRKYGRYCWTSSIAWMLALAIEQRPHTIGLWGVDMAATEEYAYQRPACQHLVGLAMAMGINIILPPESDLMRPPTMYGYSDSKPRHVKMTERLNELNGKKQQVIAAIDAANRDLHYLNGAIENQTYVLGHWIDDDDYNPVQAMSYAAEYERGNEVPPPEVEPIEPDTGTAGPPDGPAPSAES